MSPWLLIGIWIACAIAGPYTGQALYPDGSIGWGLIPFVIVFGSGFYAIWTWYGGWGLFHTLGLIGFIGAGYEFAQMIGADESATRGAVYLFGLIGWIALYVVTVAAVKIADWHRSRPRRLDSDSTAD